MNEIYPVGLCAFALSTKRWSTLPLPESLGQICSASYVEQHRAVCVVFGSGRVEGYLINRPSWSKLNQLDMGVESKMLELRHSLQPEPMTFKVYCKQWHPFVAGDMRYSKLSIPITLKKR